jgi:uncharacterized protein YciI
MSGDLKVVSKKLCRGLSGLGFAFVSYGAHASDYTNTTKTFVDQLSYRSAQQGAQIGSIISEKDRITDSNDMRVIEAYYNQLRVTYISEPSRRIVTSANPVGALETYVSNLEGLFRSSSSKLKRAEVNKDNAQFDELDFKECVSNSVNLPNLNSKKEQVRSSLMALQRSMETPYMFRSMAYVAESRWEGKNTLSDGLAAFDQDLGGIVARCCRDAELDSGKCDNYLSRVANVQEDLGKNFRNVDYPPVQFTPNPLDVQQLSGQDLAEIISQRRSLLTNLRSKPTEEYADEQDVFESMARCRVRAKQFQDNRQPMSFQAAFAAAKAVKCSLFPAYASQNLETQWAKLSVAGVAVPIEGKGWDINCSKNEAEAWNTIIDQSRDPSVWGLDQMANPPYIQSLRSIPPVSTGLPMNGITADEYLMLTPTPGLDSYSVASNGMRTTGRPTNAESGPRLGNRSGGSQSGTVFNKVSRSNSGVEKGQQLVSSVRSASSSIRNNDRSPYYANRLSMGAKSTLGFLQTGVSRSKVLGTSSSATETDGVRRMVLRTAATGASRTTSEGILGSLNGAGTTTTTGNSGTGSITDIGAKNEAVKAQVKVMVEKMLSNIEYTRTKAEESRIAAMRLASEFDTAYGEMRLKAANQPPKKIQQAISEFMTEQRDLINRGAVKRAEYDAYQAAILEQSSALSRLVTFGPMNGEINADAVGGGRGTTRGSSTSSGSSMPSGLDTSGRGSTRGAWNAPKPDAMDKLWAMLNPIASAWAATTAAASDFELYYAKEWKRFVTQFGEYVEGLRKADADNGREAAQLIAARKKSITLENYAVIDADTMTTIDMFLSELEAETDYLLEGQRNKQFKLSGEVLNKIQEARQDTLKARDAWGEAQVAAFRLQPKALEDDPFVWWGFLPSIVLQ